MEYHFTTPPGTHLMQISVDHTAKGAEFWRAYVRLDKPEPFAGKYHHFQGATAETAQAAIDAAHSALMKSIEARKAAPIPVLRTAEPLGIQLNLSKLRL
jgi:hypothetical protein